MTSGQILKMFRGRNTVEKYGGQLYLTVYSWIFGKQKKPLEISGFIVVSSNSLQLIALYHFPMQYVYIVDYQQYSALKGTTNRLASV